MKLFVTDYDDTLFINEEDLKKNILLMKKLQEHDFKVMISTGRSYESIKEQIDEHHIINYDYISCGDGSILYDDKGNIVEMSIMDDKLVIPFKEFYQNLNYDRLQFSYPEGYYRELKENDTNLLGINVCLKNENLTKKILDDFNKLKRKYPNYNFLGYTHPEFTFLCIKPQGINKASTITYLKDKYHILKEDIYVIGDSANDYEMINEYQGACMNHSCQQVLDVAKKKYAFLSQYIMDILKEDD